MPKFITVFLALLCSNFAYSAEHHGCFTLKDKQTYLVQQGVKACFFTGSISSKIVSSGDNLSAHALGQLPDSPPTTMIYPSEYIFIGHEMFTITASKTTYISRQDDFIVLVDKERGESRRKRSIKIPSGVASTGGTVVGEMATNGNVGTAIAGSVVGGVTEVGVTVVTKNPTLGIAIGSAVGTATTNIINNLNLRPTGGLGTTVPTLVPVATSHGNAGNGCNSCH